MGLVSPLLLQSRFFSTPKFFLSFAEAVTLPDADGRGSVTAVKLQNNNLLLDIPEFV